MNEELKPPRRTGETKRDRQDRFLEVILDSVTDTEACKLAGIARKTLYAWIADPEDDFTDRLAAVEAPRGRSLEQRMFAVLDWATETPEKYDKILRYPNLLMFALRGLLPAKYGYKMGVSQEDARRIIDQLMGMKDDPTVRVEDGAALEDDLDKVLGLEGLG